MENLIQTENSQGVFQITMNRPDKKNALTLQMYLDLATALKEADSKSEVRVVLITGAKDSFSSGNDLKDFQQATSFDEDFPVLQFLKTISTFTKPIVAAVNGVAVGIGTTMLLHCDLVYASNTAVFQLPFVNLGLCPEAGCSYLLPKMMGHAKAAELLMLGDSFSAEKANELGIVNGVLEGETLLKEARKKALALATKPPASLRLTKKLLRRGSQQDTHETMGVEAKHFSDLLGGPEAREAFQAFFEKRMPDYSKFS